MANRQTQKSRRRRRKTKRMARQRVGDQIHVIRQNNSKGYDVEMIRDFLEHLLLEVRVQHYENLMGLKIMEEHGDQRILREVADEHTSPALVEQFCKYHAKYQTQLILDHGIDGENATQAEIDIVTEAALGALTQKRDEQIGHLEALQELFDEALMCVKVPFGVSADGRVFGPRHVISVREWIDDMNCDDAPLE